VRNLPVVVVVVVRLARFNPPPGPENSLALAMVVLKSLSSSSGSLCNGVGKIPPRREFCRSPREALRNVACQMCGVPYLSKNSACVQKSRARIRRKNRRYRSNVDKRPTPRTITSEQIRKREKNWNVPIQIRLCHPHKPSPTNLLLPHKRRQIARQRFVKITRPRRRKLHHGTRVTPSNSCYTDAWTLYYSSAFQCAYGGGPHTPSPHRRPQGRKDWGRKATLIKGCNDGPLWRPAHCSASSPRRALWMSF